GLHRGADAAGVDLVLAAAPRDGGHRGHLAGQHPVLLRAAVLPGAAAALLRAHQLARAAAHRARPGGRDDERGGARPCDGGAARGEGGGGGGAGRAGGAGGGAAGAGARAAAPRGPPGGPPPPPPAPPVKGPSAIGTDPRRMWRLTWTLAATDFRLRFFGSALG